MFSVDASHSRFEIELVDVDNTPDIVERVSIVVAQRHRVLDQARRINRLLLDHHLDRRIPVKLPKPVEVTRLGHHAAAHDQNPISRLTVARTTPLRVLPPHQPSRTASANPVALTTGTAP